MPPPRKIALFGGTFDPVHLGHIHLATLAQEALALDEVRFLPCRISPHKSGTAPAGADDRLKMLELATAAIPWAFVDDFEITQQGSSFSYLTAEAMQKRFSEARLYWIMGGDQWAALPTWKHPEKLSQCVEFVILSRGDAVQVQKYFRHHCVTGEHPASATAIRSAIANGAAAHPWLNPQVSAWIAKNHLYRH